MVGAVWPIEIPFDDCWILSLTAAHENTHRKHVGPCLFLLFVVNIIDYAYSILAFRKYMHAVFSYASTTCMLSPNERSVKMKWNEMKCKETHTHTRVLIMYQVSKEMRQYFYFSLRVAWSRHAKKVYTYGLISKYTHTHTHMRTISICYI